MRYTFPANTAYAYGIAAIQLAKIGSHPERTKNKLLGYVMSVENIKSHVSFEINSWFKNTKDNLSIDDIPKKALKQIRTVLKELDDLQNKPHSAEDIRQGCIACHHLASEFSDKILGIKKSKTKIVTQLEKAP